MPVTYKKIASVTVTAATASSMEFTSIPATYTDLVIHMSSRLNGTSDADTYVYFNNDTTNANYSFRNLQGIGTSALSGSASNPKFALTVYSDYTASTFSSNFIYIPNYAGNTNKSASVDATLENNSTTSILRLLAGLWSNTAAITSIKLDPVAHDFVQYSTATLYGISKS